VQLASASSSTVTVTPQPLYQQGSNWLTAVSSSPSLTSGLPITQTVSVNPAGLAPGVYRATLSENVAETSLNYPVNVVLVVASANCTPSQLVPVLSSLGNRFQVTAGLPLTLQAQIVDDCGAPVDSGSVSAYFAGDPPASLTDAGNGIWQGTWLPHLLAGGATGVNLHAATSAPPLSGWQSLTGAVIANPSIATITPGGVVSAASFAANAPLAPGSYISIFGSNMAAGSTTATVPYPAALGETRVWLNGQALPLVFAAPGQINAVVPYDAPVNTSAQLVVQNGNTYSMPEQVTLAAAQPAIFSQDSSGTGAAVIVVVKPDGSQFVATPSTPASAGDALVIYCTGLGAVDTTIAPGSPSPVPPARTLSQPIVTVGGQSASVLFSGLTPGYFGLYQVNAIMPAGVTEGPGVPVSIAIGGATSPTLTLAIQ
jgi:adhesin/invasin